MESTMYFHVVTYVMSSGILIWDDADTHKWNDCYYPYEMKDKAIDHIRKHMTAVANTVCGGHNSEEVATYMTSLRDMFDISVRTRNSITDFSVSKEFESGVRIKYALCLVLRCIKDGAIAYIPINQYNEDVFE